MDLVMKNLKYYYKSEQFYSYLAGLIEGDGSIYYPNKNNTVSYAAIRIAGHKKDIPFFETLTNILGYGKIILGNSQNSIIWVVSHREDVMDLCKKTKNYFRTGKFLRMQNLCRFLKLGEISLDSSELSNNGWLAGLIDADSNFNVIISNRKKAGKVWKVKKIATQWRLEISTTTSNNISNEPIIYLIAEMFQAQVYVRFRKNLSNSKKKYYNIMVVCFNEIQKNLLEQYLNTYPLLTSKRNDYENWKLIRQINKQKLLTSSTEEKIKLVNDAIQLKNKMNNHNLIINWDHLNI